MENYQTPLQKGFFTRIDHYLGTLSHGEIVMISYLISAFILLCLLLVILYSAYRAKKQLAYLKALMPKENKTSAQIRDKGK